MNKISKFVLGDENLCQVCRDAHTKGVELPQIATEIEKYLAQYRTAPEAPGNPRRAVISFQKHRSCRLAPSSPSVSVSNGSKNFSSQNGGPKLLRLHDCRCEPWNLG